MNEICPVCGAICDKMATICEECGFEDKLGIVSYWPSEEDAHDWFSATIKPYRRDWELRELRKLYDDLVVKFNNQESMYDNLRKEFFEKINNLETKFNALDVQNHPKPNEKMKFGDNWWRILAIVNFTNDQRAALLLSENVLEQRPYHENNGVTWEDCDLRRYLNGEFYDRFNFAGRRHHIRFACNQKRRYRIYKKYNIREGDKREFQIVRGFFEAYIELRAD